MSAGRGSSRAGRRRWRDLSLRIKGLVVIGLPLLALTLTGVLGLYLFAERRAVDRELQRAYAVENSLQGLQLLAQEADAAVSALLLTGNEEFADELATTEARFPRLLDGVRVLLADDPAQLDRLERIGVQFDQQFHALNTLLGLSEVLQRDAPESFGGLVVTGRVVVDGLHALTDEMLAVQRERLAAVRARQDAITDRYYAALGINLIVGIGGGLLGALLFGRGITRRVRELTVDAERLARGQRLAARDHGRDEIGHLAAALGGAAQLLATREAQLIDQLRDIRRRNHAMTLLNHLSASLQRTDRPEQSYQVFRTTVASLDAALSGAIFVAPDERDEVGAADAVGSVGAASDALPSEEGYRRAFAWGVHAPIDPDLASGAAPTGGWVQRFPLAIGDHSGVVLLHAPREIPLDLQRVLAAMSDRLALALANLWLRVDLEEQAVRDPLTGLFNRRYFEATLTREIAAAEQGDGALALIVVDIDHFKSLNDSYGHDFGDHVLRAFAELLRGAFRARDVACRFGGEEFVVILPGTSLFHAKARAERFVEEVRRLRVPLPGGGEGGVRVSVGVSAYPENGSATGSLVRSADAALYRAKAAGRDRVELAN